MPPKSADTAIAQATKDTNFLATCFKHLKQKPVVDTAAVAAELKLSHGGVNNKLRPILKAMEEAGAAWLKDQPAVSTSKRETGAKPKAKTAEVKAENGTGDGEEEGADPEPPQPRTKSQRKPLPKSANSATKRGQKAKASDTEGEDATNESAPPGKKAKVTHQAASEDQEEVGEQIKNELGADGVDDGAMKDVKDEAEED